MTEIPNPKTVEINISDDGKTVHVNVNGKCEFRANGIGTLILNRPQEQNATFAKWRDDVYTELRKLGIHDVVIPADLHGYFRCGDDPKDVARQIFEDRK